MFYLKGKRGYLKIEDDRTLYAKSADGFVPCREYMSICDYLPEGSWLVNVRPGMRATVRHIWPGKEALHAAVQEKEKEILQTITDGLKMRPARKKMTKSQKKAWEAFSRAMGNDGYICEYGAIGEIFTKIKEILLQGKEGK